jgi:D-alanine-D-alanine ligase
MKVALTYNLKPVSLPDNEGSVELEEYYAECDSRGTVEAVRDALAERHEVVLIEADQQAYGRFREERPDIVFNLAEGLWGVARESQIPAMLEMLRIPYTGSDPATLAICLDKAYSKQILSAHGIPTAAWQLVHSGNDCPTPPFGFPVVVKPLAEGSSKGVRDTSLVRNQADLVHEVERVLSLSRRPALVEEFLPGREFTVAMLGNGNSVRCLPLIEICFNQLPEGVNPIYSYEAKWIWDREEQPLEIFECPARLGGRDCDAVEQVCMRAWKALGLRDWARIDVRLDSEGRPCIIEVNPIPGVLPRPEQNSCFPKAARSAGLSFSDLLHTTLNLAIEREGLLP